MKKEVGCVTILVNNAGINFFGDITSVEDENIQNVFKTNILSHIWVFDFFLFEDSTTSMPKIFEGFINFTITHIYNFAVPSISKAFTVEFQFLVCQSILNCSIFSSIKYFVNNRSVKVVHAENIRDAKKASYIMACTICVYY